MLEITGNDIAALNDEDLRSLVGRLCESELRSHGLSTSAVTWGGDQNAADGGIDVRVKIDTGATPGGFIPRSNVGFQVKKTDFTPGLIGPEMRPSGLLRPSISGLINERGAYIIASSGSDTSDSALTGRLEAMRSAVADNTGHENLLLDFYDRNRLATWTRNHPGLVVWVRQKGARAISGWQPYSSWAVSPDGVQDEYLIDDMARLHTGSTDDKGIAVTHGIDRIRGILREARGVVRLAGLSGVGKTRLVQALFDARVGDNPLDPELVVYTDMKDDPSPQPTGMISDLVASRTRAIVVVDNCAPDLHRRITEVATAPDSLLSVITVEYDVQDDEPEGTKVFRLQPSSVELVSKLIARRFQSMAQLGTDKIAEFSGGNARVALALANTLEEHESVAGLQDEELFKRLFHQRQVHDDSLLKAAQACALLYSFQGEAIRGDDAELPKIATLVGMNAQQLFAKVAQLKQRDLVQRRSVWRAILPHAVANRLAKMALREIPLEVIERQFNTVRLMKSFSRRLGYLHESSEAKRVAEKWLAKDGVLTDVNHLTEVGLTIFNNVAPVSPETTLAAIERALSGPDASDLINEQRRRDKIGTVLHSIAYDASLFHRSVAAMIPLALAEHVDQSHPIRGMLEGLFHIYLSGTHANIEQRASVVEGLLRSNEPGRRSLGIQLFEALLKSDNFSATHSFDFGSRVRDYGYYPNSREQRAQWFAKALQLARQFVSENDDGAQAIRSMIAESIWTLWFLGPEVQEQFEAIADAIGASGYWQEGWLAVRSFLSRRRDKTNITAMERLRAFERRLRPNNIIEQVRAVVLSQRHRAIDFAEMDENDEIDANKLTAAYEKAYTLAEELGKAVCGDDVVFMTLLPDLVKSNGARLVPFGRGLALAAVNHRNTWEQLTQAFAATDWEKRNAGAFVGFLNGLSTVDQQLCDALLEDSVAHDILGACFPVLQSSVAISAAGADRLKRAITIGKAKPSEFIFLGWRPDVTEDDLRTIVLSMTKQQKGFIVAIDILSARLERDAREKREYETKLVDAGRELLASADFGIRDNMYDYNLHAIAKACLPGAEGSVITQLLCDRIKQGFVDRTFRPYDYEGLLQCIFQLQPQIALDAFFGEATQSDDTKFDVDEFDSPSNRHKSPLDGASVDELLRWCDEKPIDRYPAVSRAVSYHSISKDEGAEWTPVAMEMLKRSPDPLAVLKTFVLRFSPTSWWGSRAAIVESRLGLLDRLGELNNAALNDYVTRIRPQLVDDIARMRASEDERDSERDEQFE
jgi:hypothetical protein